MPGKPRKSWNSSRLFALAVAAALVFSSGSVPAAERGRVLVERSAKKRPDWIVRPPQSEQFLYSVGFSTAAASLDEGRTAAALDAVEDIVFFLSLRATARYEQRRTHLATEILSLIETSGTAEVPGGRTAELYFERYKEKGAGGAREFYDVYLLFRVPLGEIEAERKRILAARAEAKRRAASVVADTSIESMAADFIGGLSRLIGARSELERAAPGASALHSIDVLLAEVALRTRVALESVELVATDERRREIRASATLLGASGPLPLSGIPLEFEVAQGSERAVASAVTDSEGWASVSIRFPLDPFLRALVQVRLHPSLLQGGEDSANLAGTAGDAGQPILSRFEGVNDYRVVHLVPGGEGGVPRSVDSSSGAEKPARASRGARAPGPTITILTGSETVRKGRRSSVLVPVLVRVTAAPPPADAPLPLNLALVLDCSESMYESGKIDYLREAASLVVRSMGREDVLTVVTYGAEASVLLPAQGIEARRTLLYELARLAPCGRSNLGAGIERALEEISPHIRPGSVTRLLVLTDGKVNEGADDVSGLVRIAGKVKQSGASLGIVGLGHEVARELLAATAEAGGGSFARATSASNLPSIMAREIGGALPRYSNEIEIDLDLAPVASLIRAYGYPVRVSQRSLGVVAGGLPVGESRSILLDLEVDCSYARAKWVGKITVEYRDRSRHGPGSAVHRVQQDLGVSCAPGRATATRSKEIAHVDLFAQLSRAADTLEVVLYDWDLRLLEEVDNFLAQHQPRLRREVEALDDAELTDLVRFIDRGAVDMWAGVSRMAEAIEERETRRNPELRLFKLQHYDTQMKPGRD